MSLHSRYRVALAAATLLCLSGLARAEEKVAVSWRGKEHATTSLPADLPQAPRAAIAEWEAWAARAGYRMDLDANARVLLLGAEKRSRAEQALEIVARAQAWFDEFLPATDAAPVAAKASKPAGKSAEKPGGKPAAKKTEDIPEDPEGAPPVLVPPKGSTAPTGKKSAGEEAPAGSSTWGSGSFAPDSRTAVVIVLADEEDQESALAHLGKAHPELADWAAKAGKELGFVIENPLLAAYVESASGQEEWNPEHELLNRLVRLFILGRFGQMPNWLMQGVAWEAENAFDGSIWVYPYRSEFVYTTEHTAWPMELANEFEDRAKKPLQIEELTGWTRGTWDGTRARHAFGLIHYLAAAKKQALPGVLADLRAHRDETNRKSTGDGTWVRNTNWESPPADQLAILRSRCGENVLADTGTWLARQGSSKTRDVQQEGRGKLQQREK